jgi:glycine cleavage system H protein
MKKTESLKFSEGHVWARRIGDMVRVGITEQLLDKLKTDVFEVELIDEESEIEYDEVIGHIISSDDVSLEITSPVSGRIMSINHKVFDYPELLLEDTYGDGWLMDIELADSDELDDLMDENEYKKYIGQEEGEEEI